MPRFMMSRALAALALLAAIAACDSSSPAGPGNEPGPAPVATVTVAADLVTLVAGEGTQARASLRDAEGRTLTDRTITWNSTDLAVATVAPGGAITSVAPGTTRIVATSEGKQGEVQLTVLPRSTLVAAVTLDATTLVLARGASRQLIATPRDAQGTPVTGVIVQWSIVTTTASATISDAGLVTAIAPGTATITARAGDRTAAATVTVLADATHDLVFERWGTDAAGISRPSLHRLDLADPSAEPVDLFGIAGAFDAAPSPDGSKLAFTCTTGHATGICVTNGDGSGARLLPGFGELTGLRADQPAWSPDGTKIAFRGWAMGGDVGIFNPGNIWVMDADGSNKVKLTAGVPNVDSYQSPAWSPRLEDGSYRIAFARESRGVEGYQVAHLESMRADGGDRKVLTTVGAGVDASPTWSPNGATIAFVRTGGTAAGDIWLVNAIGGGERALMAGSVEPEGAQRSPAWSPDGSAIAFVSNHEVIANYFAWQIYTVRADGTGLQRRTAGPAEKGNPAWIKR